MLLLILAKKTIVMDRRNALKKIGSSLGYLVATPTILGILQSCQKDPDILWTPKFFTKNEGIVIRNLTNLILPSTESSPGAIDVDVPQFLDLYYNEVEKEIQQNFIQKGLQSILNNLGSQMNQITKMDYDKLLARFLKADKKEKEKFKKNKEENYIYGTLLKIRELAVWAFLTSQEIGEEVLAYDPIPGKQIGCISVEEATMGKKWSL